MLLDVRFLLDIWTGNKTNTHSRWGRSPKSKKNMKNFFGEVITQNMSKVSSF